MIACVLKSGGIYEPWHAQVLASQMRMAAPHEPFVCLTDVAVDGVSTIPLQHGWPGWWSKLELFRPDVFPAGERVLFADLDTLVLGDLSDLLAIEAPFVTLEDFYRRPPMQPVRGLGSGLMQWTAGDQTDLYARFAADAEGLMRRHQKHGDQQFIERLRLADVTFWQDVVPEQVVSYKLHCRTGIPAKARVVCFHGTPKPWDVSSLGVRH